MQFTGCFMRVFGDLQWQRYMLEFRITLRTITKIVSCFAPKYQVISLKKVDACDNSFSVAPFTIDEVKKVIWACDSNKSPGLDGFSFRFIKEDWEKMKSC